MLRRVSLAACALFFAGNTHPARQDNARELDRAPHREVRRPIEHLAATRNQLRAQHELRELAHGLERNLTAVGYSTQQRRGGCMDVVHWHNALFIVDTVSEMGRFGTFGGPF